MMMRPAYRARTVKEGLSLIICLMILVWMPIRNGFCSGYTYININDPFIRKIPVAVTDFQPMSTMGHEGEDGNTARDILSQALDFTGYLKIMDRAAFLDDPSKTGITREAIRFGNWTSLGAELLVTGGIVETAESVSLQLRLFDTFKEKMLVGKIYTGVRSDIRKMVLRFCGEISQNLTGKWGIFSSQIAFVSTVKGNKEVFVCDFDGHDPRQITDLKSITLSPAWSSDSQWLAYTSYTKGNPDLYIKHINEKRGSVIDFKGLNITPDWVPGQFALAACLSFSGDQEIYLLTGKGKIIKRITQSWGIDLSPDFSPDGKQVAFVSRRAGTPQIYIQDVDGDSARRLTFEGQYNTSPAWSPDGDRIAYVGSRDGKINIYVMGIDGTGPVQLTRDTGDNEDPSWSPDGSLIVFSSTREGKSRIYVMTAAGGEQRRLLTLDGAQTDPAWSLGTAGN
ncbi:MAG: Tol-Pal system beta propeller repeat protein TolB [Pseudomonadota bacterium]